MTDRLACATAAQDPEQDAIDAARWRAIKHAVHLKEHGRQIVTNWAAWINVPCSSIEEAVDQYAAENHAAHPAPPIPQDVAREGFEKFCADVRTDDGGRIYTRPNRPSPKPTCVGSSARNWRSSPTR